MSFEISQLIADYGNSNDIVQSNNDTSRFWPTYTSQTVDSILGASQETRPSSNASFNHITQDLLGKSTNNFGDPLYLSDVENAILRSVEPIQINETEEISVNGYRGIWANKQEVINWKSNVPIAEYLINQDSNPDIVTKKSQQKLEYIQEMAIRYLKPPTPPPPGEIIIQQQPNIITPPAPPLIIRQQPIRPATPEPLVIREAPPPPPPQVGKKMITISGKRVPPPPRKVIIERLPQLPSKPQSVLIERWLPYAQVRRRVIFNKPTQADPVIVKPKNVIVQWEAPQVSVKREQRYLGVIKANPVEYVQRYGTTLRRAHELPKFVLDIKTPDGLTLAADTPYNNLHELYGDVSALKLVDLEKEGLGEYRSYLQRLLNPIDNQYSYNYSNNNDTNNFTINNSLSFDFNKSQQTYNNYTTPQRKSSSSSTESELSGLVEQIFKSVDIDQDGKISVEEAEKIILRLNSRLGRRYGEDDVRSFFYALDSNNDGRLDLEEFKKAFLSIV